MATEDEREVVRVRVKKFEGGLPEESRSFAVDPQITSLDVLHHILIRAFKLKRKSKFGVSYLCRDRHGANHGEEEVYLPLQSDKDLDSSFSHSAQPYLLLKMDIKPAEDSPLLEGWDVISPKDVIGSDLLGERRGLAAAALPFTQSLLSQVSRTLWKVQQALSGSEEEELKPLTPPLSDSELHSFLNGQGQLCNPEQLRLRIYHGGVEPSLRKVVWRYLLNVYPDGLTGQERMDYMKRQSRKYEQLKSEWPARVAPGELADIRSNVRKDVLRTDRTHSYFAGSEDGPHLSALADLLTTYAITHPQVSYCQGMSDLASPILAVMDNEAHAYICFCGLMKRLERNFAADGWLMSLKFQHLRLLLEHCDPELFGFLRARGADGLLFCYRWLLLELKREFAFEHALRMLEVCWSSLPPDPPETELQLCGPPVQAARPGSDEGGTDGDRTLRPRSEGGGGGGCQPQGEAGGCRGKGEGSAVLTECKESAAVTPACEQVPSSGDFRYYSAHTEGASEPVCCPAGGQELEKGGIDASEREPLIPSNPAKGSRCTSTSELAGAAPDSPSQSNTQTKLGSEHLPNQRPASPIRSSNRHACASVPNRITACSPTTPTGSGFTVGGAPFPSSPGALPPPHEFGGGNPFMLFLCVSLLLEQKAHIMRSDLDHNELAMHFDRLVRRHNLSQVLRHARALFAEYLRNEVWDSLSLECKTRSGSTSPNSTYKLTNTVPAAAASAGPHQPPAS